MLYKLTRTDHPSVDEYTYQEIVVRAASEGQARRLVCRTDKDGSPMYHGFRPDGSNVQVERIESSGPIAIICTSFSAS